MISSKSMCSTRVCIYVEMYMYVYVHVHRHTHICICMYTCVSVFFNLFAYRHTHVCMYKQISCGLTCGFVGEGSYIVVAGMADGDSKHLPTSGMPIMGLNNEQYCGPILLIHTSK